MFSNKNQLITAYQTGNIDTHAVAKVRIDGKLVETTPGRVMFTTMLPPEVRDYGATYGKKQIAKLIAILYKKYGAQKTSELLDKIKAFGYHYGTLAGVTVSVEDLEIPATKKGLLEKADKQVLEVDEEYRQGKIINDERYRRTVEIWSDVTEQVTKDMMDNLDEFNPVYMMATSGARGSIAQMRQLAGMRGLMADTQGRIMEKPIKVNFREGLSVLDFFMSSHGARKGASDRALRTADSGYLTRRLVDISHEVIIKKDDCGCHGEGLLVSSLVDSGEVIEPLAERIYGRRLAQDLVHDGVVVAKYNTMVTDELNEKIKELGITEVMVRSPLTCKLENKGVCRKCYGIDLSNHKEILKGEAVGVIAAQSIGEPGTQLTMRTFHTGGVAQAAAVQSSYKAIDGGKIKYVDLELITDENGREIVATQTAKAIVGKHKYEIPSGSTLMFKNGERVKKGEVIVEFDPFQTPIISTKAGRISYRDIYIKENVDIKYNVIEKLAIKPSENNEINPRAIIYDEKTNKKLAEYSIPYGAYIMHSEKEHVNSGEIIAKIVKTAEGTKDITGGLPRVQELFEARNPKGKALLSDVAGRVILKEDMNNKKGARTVIITDPETGEEIKQYVIQGGERLVVTNEMLIEKGAKITDGPISPHDMLRVKGEVAAQQFILEAVQGVYRGQGVTVNDKHIEIIVKQMFQKVRILESGSTLFLEEELVDKKLIENINRKKIEEGKQPAKYEPIIQGITKAAVNTESFISASSFQETTKVLANAAIEGKVDRLEGLKENVIIGKKIPGGTGFKDYNDLKVEELEEISEDEI